MKAKGNSRLPERLRAVCGVSADSARAEQGFAHLAATPAAPRLETFSAEQGRLLAGLFAGSDAMGQLLLKHVAWIEEVLQPDRVQYPRQAQGLRREVDQWLAPALQARDYAGAFARLRQFKQRELLRIATRDLARLGDAPQITREISDVADVALQTTLTLCRQQLIERLGQPYHPDPLRPEGAWSPTPFVVLGLGKLGGQELNYSSDVDVIFVYGEEGHVFHGPPKKKVDAERLMTSHQFFKRLAESFIAEVSRSTPEGVLFRIDLRLRPEGETGPLVRSLESYESFYAQWGQTWERMMLIKARGVAGDLGLAAEFLEMIQPFRYPRSLGAGALQEIAAMKARIEQEVVRSGEMDRNVKLGRGGIREIEFIVQTAQILKAGHIPFLQGAQTLPLLEKLAQYRLLEGAEARDLASAYCFLRDVEHRVQMEHNLQTHTIPADPPAQTRLARLMGFPDRARFERALRRHTRRVRELYEKMVQTGAPTTPSPFPRQIKGAEEEWKRILARHNFKEVDRSLRLLHEFAHGPGYVHVSQRTTELAMRLLPRLFALCRTEAEVLREGRLSREVLSDPDRVLARLDSFITAYAARALMFETWTSHPQIFELLLRLFDRSEFLAEIAIRTPDLVDDLVVSGRLGRAKTAAEILTDLRYGREDADQRLWLRRYHQAEFMRIGLRSILGLADTEQNFLELTALADACVQYALEITLRQQRLKGSPVAIMGLGKLGGEELTYGSDLDLVFVAGDGAARQLPRLVKVAAGVMEMLSSQTELGLVFVTDARLRPDGEKGLLVNTLGAFREYYLERAQLWELQALTRTRPIAGDPGLGRSFQELARELTSFQKFGAAASALAGGAKVRRTTKEGRTPQAMRVPAGYAPDWKRQITRMRARIEKERTPAGQDALAFKTGSGGLIDAEFIAQALCLQEGWLEANTLRALLRARDEKVLSAADGDALIRNYRELRRLECILRRWSFEGETELPVDPAPYYRVSVRCGFGTPEAFRQALAGWRQAIRAVYRKVFAE